jgi:hypothetical protein
LPAISAATILDVCKDRFFSICANAINIGADPGAMGDATRLLIGRPVTGYVLFFGVFA